MNEIAKISTPSKTEVIDVLRNSLYPGAKPESVELVLSYCRVNGIDPMLKAVHIVPTSVKVGDNKWEMRDILMPGIADYRIKAARSGEYGGKSEPEFGPDVTRDLDGIKITFPQWCRVTVQRIVAGQARSFTAKEYWMENYATKKRDTSAPNAMWTKRAYGQLAKCSEAQALRMAFPEFSGGAPTAEEMEGKTIDAGFSGPTIDAKPISEPALQPQSRKRTVEDWLKELKTDLDAAADITGTNEILAREDVKKAREKLTNGAKVRLEEMIENTIDRVSPIINDGEYGQDTKEGTA